MDPLHHPDLRRVGRRMRNQLEETLDAEQHAARATALRISTFRDRLIELADRGRRVAIHTSSDGVHVGHIDGVGVDYLVLQTEHSERLVTLSHVVSCEEIR